MNIGTIASYAAFTKIYIKSSLLFRLPSSYGPSNYKDTSILCTFFSAHNKHVFLLYLCSSVLPQKNIKFKWRQFNFARPMYLVHYSRNCIVVQCFVLCKSLMITLTIMTVCSRLFKLKTIFLTDNKPHWFLLSYKILC